MLARWRRLWVRAGTAWFIVLLVLPFVLQEDFENQPQRRKERKGAGRTSERVLCAPILLGLRSEEGDGVGLPAAGPP
jgi:hypothetical protein